MAHKADTSERLSSEPIRPQLLQILKLAQLARRVPRAQKRQVGFIDPVTVVRNLYRLEPAVLERELDRGRARVERVLDELLDCVGRAVDDLPVSDR